RPAAMSPECSRKILPMLKKLSSPWIGSIIGLVCYLAVTWFTWNAATAKLGAVEEAHGEPLPQGSNLKATMIANVEVDALVKELRDERETVAKREQELNEWASRLRAERDELNQLTQTVHRLQKDFDLSVTKVTEEETANLKKLAKTYTTMEPEAAAAIFKQM